MYSKTNIFIIKVYRLFFLKVKMSSILTIKISHSSIRCIEDDNKESEITIQNSK